MLFIDGRRPRRLSTSVALPSTGRVHYRATAGDSFNAALPFCRVPCRVFGSIGNCEDILVELPRREQYRIL